MDTNAVESRLGFIIEIDRMKDVLRRSPVFSGVRRENDAEHSWHIAAMALVLHPLAGEEVELGHVLEMLAVHDLVEIYAGDTFAYDREGNLDKARRESDAADRLFGMLPGGEGARLRALWEEFDMAATPDSRFAAALDRLEPLIANRLNSGGTWREFGVTARDVLKRMEPVRGAIPALWDYVLKSVAWGVAEGHIRG